MDRSKTILLGSLCGKSIKYTFNVHFYLWYKGGQIDSV